MLSRRSLTSSAALAATTLVQGVAAFDIPDFSAVPVPTLPPDASAAELAAYGVAGAVIIGILVGMIIYAIIWYKSRDREKLVEP